MRPRASRARSVGQTCGAGVFSVMPTSLPAAGSRLDVSALLRQPGGRRAARPARGTRAPGGPGRSSRTRPPRPRAGRAVPPRPAAAEPPGPVEPDHPGRGLRGQADLGARTGYAAGGCSSRYRWPARRRSCRRPRPAAAARRGPSRAAAASAAQPGGQQLVKYRKTGRPSPRASAPAAGSEWPAGRAPGPVESMLARSPAWRCEQCPGSQRAQHELDARLAPVVRDQRGPGVQAADERFVAAWRLPGIGMLGERERFVQGEDQGEIGRRQPAVPGRRSGLTVARIPRDERPQGRSRAATRRFAGRLAGRPRAARPAAVSRSAAAFRPAAPARPPHPARRRRPPHSQPWPG